MIVPLLADVTVQLWPLGYIGKFGCCSCGGILTLIMCFFVLVDADRRDQPACLWAILVLFTNIIGVLIYLIVVGLSNHRR